MKKFIFALFGKKQSSEPKTVSLDEQLRDAVARERIEDVITLLKQGAGVNFLFLDPEYMGDGEWTKVKARTLDCARTKAMERLLRSYGAKTQAEFDTEEAVAWGKERAAEKRAREAAREAAEARDREIVDAFLAAK